MKRRIHPKIPGLKHAEAIELAKSKPISEIAKLFNTTTKQVVLVFKENGLKPPRGNRDYVFNEDFFEKIDSHEKAYCLGFLYADGCVSRNHCVSVRIQESDEEILRFIAKCVDYKGPIRHLKKKGNRKDQKVLSLFSKKMCQDLINLGCLINKCKVLTFPTKESVPPEFKWSFLLGYLDGDGTAYIGKGRFMLCFKSSPYFCEGLSEWLLSNGIKSYTERYNYTESCGITVVGKNGIPIMENMIKNQKFSLKKKRDRMEYFIFIQSNKIFKKPSGALKDGALSLESYHLFKDTSPDLLFDIYNIQK